MSSIPHTRSLPSRGGDDDAYSSMMENMRGMRKGAAAPGDRRHRDEYSDGVYSEEARPALGVPVSDSSESDNDTLLNVEIKSSEEGFYIPVTLMIEREEMMRETAQEFGIGDDRWSGSLLYREWSIATDDDASSVLENRVERHRNGDVTLYLDPEGDCKASNHSHSLMWRPWLTTCMRAFYNTGTVRVPDDCMGSDILLALEYFGIVYTPDQLIFDSFGAYLRVKLWSEYFTHRSRLAQWVVQRLMSTNAKHSHNFVTSPSKEEGDILVGSKRATVIDGDLQLDPAKYTDTTSRSVVHDFFDDEEQQQPEGSEYPLDSLMRDDFASYVQHSLPGTRVTFQRRAVQIFQTGKVLKRSILHVDFISPSQKAKVDKKMATTPTTPKRTTTKVVPAAVTPTTTTTARSRSRSPAALFKKLGRRRSGSKDSRDGSSSASIEPSPVATPTSVTAPIAAGASKKSRLRTGAKSSIDGSDEPQEPKVLKRFGSRLRRSPSKSSIDGSEGGTSRFSIDVSEGGKLDAKKESGSESCEAPDISNEEFSPERQQGESSNAFSGPRDPAKLPEIKGVLSADHINVEMRKESKLKEREKDQTSYSVDQLNSVFNGLESSDEKKVGKESSRAHGSLPSDEKRGVSLAPSDERRLASPSSDPTDPPAPVKLISYGDMTVASGITSPWREDEGPMFKAPYIGAAQRSSRSAPSLRGVLADKVSNTTTRPLKPPSIQRKGNVAGVFEANSAAAHILEEGNESDTDTELFSSGNNTGSTTPTLATVEESPVVTQCGADALSSAWCYMFGGSSSKKTAKQSDTASLDASLMGQGQGALTTIEALLPEVDILTHATPEVEIAYMKNKGKGETLEAAASTWLRNVVDFNQLLFDDPLLETDDEYSRLARKAEVGRPPARPSPARPPSRSGSPARSPSPLTCATLDAITDPAAATKKQAKSRSEVPRPVLKNPTAPAEKPPGTRVKDILDKLMRDNIPEESTALPVGCGNAAAENNDNTSAIGSAIESIVSTSASSKGTSLFRDSDSSAITMTKDQFVAFGDMESICSSKCSKLPLCAEPADPPPKLRLPPGSPSSIGTPVQGSSVFIPKPMPIGKVGLIRSVSPRLRRLRTPTKERKGATPTKERKGATPTKGRFGTPNRTPTRGTTPTKQQQQPTPPRSPHHMGVEERTRSPLARLPGLLPVRWGKRSSSTTSEATPVIRNGDVEADLSLEENDDSFSLGQNSQKSKSKIGGLFRAKGSALKRNLLDIRRTNSKEKEMVEKFKQSEEYQKMIAEGKLYAM